MKGALEVQDEAIPDVLQNEEEVVVVVVVVVVLDPEPVPELVLAPVVLIPEKFVAANTLSVR